MGNPLTSKERRGLVAVAAAALLCISSGFIVRNCTSFASMHTPDSHENSITDKTIENVSSGKATAADTIASKSKRKKSSGSRKTRKSKRKSAEKNYPVRDPLSQPCD
ncbi:MAG: hypothetical protein K2G77_04995 [Muribaculaceae bacterium]|nr:hypothetical protein [Muribaculaceae bacterium]